MLAKRQNDAERFDEAAEVARETERTSVLEGYIRNELARALAGAGDANGANAEWDAVLLLPSTTSTARAEIYRARIALAEDAGDTAALAVALDGLIAVTGDAEARFERAGLAREAGAWNVFETQLKAIIADTPASTFAPLAIVELRDADIAIDPGQEGLVYYRRDAYSEAKRVLLPSLDDPNATLAQFTFRAYYLGAAYEDSGDYANAIRYYDMAAASGASSPFIHRAKYWAARSAEAAEDFAEASERYVALVADGPSGEFTEESAFRAGYVLLRDDDLTGAIAAWDGAGAASSARMEYWKGRAQEESGDEAAASESYRRAISLGEYDFHGLEAAVRLGLRDPVGQTPYVERDLLKDVDWDAVASWLESRVPGDWPGSNPTAACDLMASGLRAQARAELNAAANGSTAWRTLELAREAHICGVTDVGAQLAVKLRQQAGVKSHEAPRDLLRVSYPIEFGVTLDAEARERDIDPLFFAALVRQESYWDPVAGSHAGALGLTQVIPPTGQGIANALGYSSFSPSDLFRPAVALEFGAFYLGGQIARFGDPLLALTAYNAGPGNAARWKERPRDSAADLVESVDFRETKLYVTYIYESYAHYQLAWVD
jgi:soluble lytic murein transglycosylase